MRRVALLAALFVGAAVAAAAGSPRKLLDAATQKDLVKKMKDGAMAQAEERLGSAEGAGLQLPTPRSVGAGGGGGSVQQQQSGATIANPVHIINPNAGETLDAVQSPPSKKPTDVSPKLGLAGSGRVEVDMIPDLITSLPPISAPDLPSALASVEGNAAAQAGNSIAATFIKASVKDGVADALAGGFVQAGCQGGTNFALSISLGTAAVTAGRPFVSSFNQALARQFPSSRCSSCYTRTLNQANTVAQSLGGGDGFSSASSIGFALGVCIP